VQCAASIHRRQSGVAALLVAAVSALALPAATAARDMPSAATAAVHRGLDPGLRTLGRRLQRVIVSGRVTAELPIVDGVAADVRADRLTALADDAAVKAVTANRRATFEDIAYDSTTTASNFARTSGAAAAWAQNALGQGIGVAVLDTGVSAMNDFAGRLVHGPDLSGEGTTVDTFGHGTVMAGVIGGSGADSAGNPGGAYTGVAPGATLVAVKTAGRNGVVDVSTILQAMHWVAAYQSQYNIRVLNLSWGVASTQAPAIDPLDYAVERLWGQGIVVVVSAGNSGPLPGTVTKPGDDPVVLTVGAVNDQGDANPANDSVPSWSSQGPTAGGLFKPDLVAPGRSLVATRSFGSAIEADNPQALFPPSYIRGSGTSQAAAVASGVVADLLSARPSLTPDQVKSLLTSTASAIPLVSAFAQGHGRIQLGAALAAQPGGLGQARPANGLGSIEASRGGSNVVSQCNGAATVIQGEMDVRCDPWNAPAWTGSAWTGDAWTGVSWKGTSWYGSSWYGVSWKDDGWSQATWDGVSWKGGAWQSDSWDGSANWNGDAAGSWTGVSWKGSSWDGVSWKDSGWTAGDWAASGFLTAFWGDRPPAGRYLPGEAYTSLPAAALVGHGGRA
jgi:serine protease AprX